jgi:hypothetical protein
MRDPKISKRRLQLTKKVASRTNHSPNEHFDSIQSNFHFASSRLYKIIASHHSSHHSSFRGSDYPSVAYRRLLSHSRKGQPQTSTSRCTHQLASVMICPPSHVSPCSSFCHPLTLPASTQIISLYPSTGFQSPISFASVHGFHTTT